jgi:very-short-patch-repair endonuclease
MDTRRNDAERKAIARRLRRNLTLAETLLWMELKGQKLGVKFRRQAPIGPYVIDFLCRKERLIVELDGSQHGGADDEIRDRWLRGRDFRILRIWNSIVLEDVEEALIMIRKQILPLPGEGGFGRVLPLPGEGARKRGPSGGRKG